MFDQLRDGACLDLPELDFNSNSTKFYSGQCVVVRKYIYLKVAKIIRRKGINPKTHLFKNF
jgi:hypothetical protein